MMMGICTKTAAIISSLIVTGIAVWVGFKLSDPVRSLSFRHTFCDLFVRATRTVIHIVYPNDKEAIQKCLVAVFKGQSKYIDHRKYNVTSTDITIDDTTGLRIRLYEPPAATLKQTLSPGLIWYHGGGFTIGSLEEYDAVCIWISQRAGIKVVSVDYRLSPKHQFPIQVEDGYFAAKWVYDHALDVGIDKNKLALGGDSAGGNIALVVAMMARDKNRERGSKELEIAFQTLVYPIVDMTMSMPSIQKQRHGPIISKEWSEWFLSCYIPKGHDLKDPKLSPLFAEDFSELPPTFIQACGLDMLVDEDFALFNKLQKHGQDAKFRKYPNFAHGIFNQVLFFPHESRLMVNDLVEQLLLHLKVGNGDCDGDFGKTL